MSRRLYVGLRGLANGAAIRSAEFEGRSHLVVPVVMMVGDAVVWPLGSTGPEFVPAEELAALPPAWDGEPVVTNHPEIGGKKVSANIPVILETMALGQCFNTTFRNGSLQTEAWLDLDKAASLGGDAQAIVDRVIAGEIVEVSVGCWITAVKDSGESPSGEAYELKWTEIAPDHLALLPEGTEGACSVEMGCGTPRAARRSPNWTPPRGRVPSETDRPPERVLALAEEGPIMSWTAILRAIKTIATRSEPGDSEAREAVRGLVQSLRAAQDSMSDGELRTKLWVALETDVPAFDWVEDVFSSEGIVIYSIWPPDGPVTLWRRGFTVSDSGEVSLQDNAEQVESVTRYEPVEAADGGDPTSTMTSTATRASCPCQTTEGDPPTMTDSIKALIARLTDGSLARSPFRTESIEVLARFDEEKLQAMAESFEDPVVEIEDPETEEIAPPVVETAPLVVDENVVTLSKEEHRTLTALARESEERNAAERTRLVNKLVEKSGEGSKETFESMELKSLRQLAVDLKVDEPAADFSLAHPVGDPGGESDEIPAPKSLEAHIKEQCAN